MYQHKSRDGGEPYPYQCTLEDESVLNSRVCMAGFVLGGGGGGGETKYGAVDSPGGPLTA